MGMGSILGQTEAAMRAIGRTTRGVGRECMLNPMEVAMRANGKMANFRVKESKENHLKRYLAGTSTESEPCCLLPIWASFILPQRGFSVRCSFSPFGTAA